MSNFVPRLTAPVTATNKYYRYPGYYDGNINGVNDCLLINSSTGAIMPNCVGYAWGRAAELENDPKCTIGVPTSRLKAGTHNPTSA